MPFVQETAPTTPTTPASAVPETATSSTAAPTTPETTASAPASSPAPTTPQTPPDAVPAKDTASDTKATTPEAKTDAKTDVKSDIKSESKPTVTITKSETVTRPLPPKAPSDAIWLFTWVPLIVMIGLWLYLRGRNQAAMRARDEAMLAATKKTKKKSSYSSTEVDGVTGLSSQSTSDRTSKGNSKKNKKDKQQQKKKQQLANSGATASKANNAAIATKASAPVALTSKANEPANQTSKKATSSSTISAESNTNIASTAAERKAAAPVAQPAKAIFEPLRKVTASAKIEANDTDFESEEGEEQDFAPTRGRRPAPPAPVITTPTKVTGGRFEKLNVPAANAGMNASSANRWPSEAVRPPATVRAPQQSAESRANSIPKLAQADSETAAGPITARGLGAFLKTAKPSATSESTGISSAEVQAESSGS